jgi:hypothetical protein
MRSNIKYILAGIVIAVVVFTFAIIMLFPTLRPSLLKISGVSHASEESNISASPEVLQNAAQKGLPRFLNAITGDKLRQFNFSSQDELKTATLGIPFQVYVVKRNEVLHSPPEISLMDVVHPTPMWFFPIISQGVYRTILTVDRTENDWKAIEIGNSDLANSFASVLSKWPSSEGYQYFFVRNYETLSEFIILINKGKTQVIPLPTAISSLELSEEKILEPSEFLLLLKNRFKKLDSRGHASQY